MGNILLIVIVLAVFYALMILPQRRQAKQRTAMMNQLSPGARVVTTSGIYGDVVEITDDRIYVNIAPDVEVELDPRAILRVVEPASTVPSEPEEEETPISAAVDESDDAAKDGNLS
ncbi:preprotein translocase subunit YajC [Alicyclobacillus mengziensis]|uniref:Preprotein translocase subunit YajC n=1 Tax=Alicyclobacillus mengziensis TaxID=2931921 RepID=A0A9X7VWP3_9BACL|nr:preprotein translocase subunit YajC [Alicyclobacillus mengziensis]QSO46237.1 preprotein translocase subunit YajC [Alicyclobacillus mengziensis]